LPPFAATVPRNHQIQFCPQQFGRLGEQTLGVLVQPDDLDRQVLAFAKTGFFQFVQECRITSGYYRIIE
jgi:hypothetical protein